ncbi:efflux RND transporter permease subunit [Dielma fastidiosa]|uniref:MMPL family transporter n=2 Tax=Dielma fastidiosa TaxID=1034346 RepID=A0AB35UR00_9FIRM|nr:MMPL family transporter [Dielma fastidiosa]MDY5168327.1 MMPL family transporter [Dielma fastidiosa]
MKKETEEAKPGFVDTAAAFIVDKRNGFFLAFIGFAIFCVFSTGWVQVNDDLTSYLPAETETRQGLTIMDEEFVTFGSAEVMVDNLTIQQAEKISDELTKIQGVKSVEFDESKDHFNNASALFSVTFDGESDDEISIQAMNEIKAMLVDEDVYIVSEVGSSQSDEIASEMNVVMIIAVVIIIAVLLFTSHTYMEIPVLLITFAAAAILNMGTNFIFGEISFVSNSIAVVLQLALALDYAIILCHRYTEERTTKPAREAVITALSKAIPEISGSCLTTISGLIAMMFMQFKIGYDMGLVLIKAILFSILCVFTLMPGLLMLFSPWIDKTHHRSFVPKISAWGKLTVKTRKIVPPIFVLLLVGAFIFSNRCPYVYGYSTLTTAKQNESQIAADKIEANFGSTNMMALLVPSGDYKTEAKLLAKLEAKEHVQSVMGLANIEAMDGYVLTDTLSPRQFAELTDLDIEIARLLYGAYAADQKTYGQIVSGIDNYSVPLIDMFMFLYDQKEAGYVSLAADLDEELEDIHNQLTDAQVQLLGEHYSRILIYLDLPEESPETFAFLQEIHQCAREFYDSEDLYLVGNSTNDFDLSASFSNDNILISILSAVFVIIVLLFTFKSAGLPILLILVIQGSIWMNFSFPYLSKTNLFFMSYLVVSSIQMGANIDYAIVITNRYTSLKKEMPIADAMVEALNQAFPTIVTSGMMLASAGTLIGQLSSDPAISSIGTCLGRGTILSILLVMGVLPQILMLGDMIIEKTAFTLKKPSRLQTQTGSIKMNGHVRGYVSGMIDADFKGTLQGTISAAIEAGKIETASEVIDDEKA